MITPKEGYIVDPNNPNGVIHDPNYKQGLIPIGSFGQTMTTPVVTGTTAQTDLNNIQSQHANITTGMANQAAQTKAQTDAQTAADAANRANQEKMRIEQQNADARTAAATGTTTSTTTSTETNPDIQARDQALADYQTRAQKAQDDMDNIRNGTIPLTPGQQAQIDGLKAQFQQLIDNQKLTNTGASGTANVRGYQQGAGEYDPTFQTSTINSIVSAGAQKVAQLNTQMAEAVAKLTQAFQTDDIDAIKNSWNIYNQAQEKRIEALNETVKNSQTIMTKIQEANQKQQDMNDKAQRDNAIANYMSETGETNPVEILKQLGNAGMNTLTFDDVSSFTDKMKLAEKTIPGIVGEWMNAKELDPSLANVSLIDYIKMKDPGSAADLAYKQAQIDQIYANMALNKAELAQKAKEQAGNKVVDPLTGQETSELKINARNSAIALLDKMNEGVGTSAVGGSRIFGLQNIPGTAPRDFTIQFDNLKSLLSLDNVKLLKGQGAVSDAERRLLSDASAKLDLSQSEGEFLASLKEVNIGLGNPQEVTLTDKSGASATLMVDAETLEQARRDGLKITF